jgi:hypothetical protein
MRTITFNLVDKHENKKVLINKKIYELNGVPNTIKTKDGIAYVVDFDNEKKGIEFNFFINKLIPNLFEY